MVGNWGEAKETFAIGGRRWKELAKNGGAMPDNLGIPPLLRLSVNEIEATGFWDNDVLEELWKRVANAIPEEICYLLTKNSGTIPGTAGQGYGQAQASQPFFYSASGSPETTTFAQLVPHCQFDLAPGEIKRDSDPDAYCTPTDLLRLYDVNSNTIDFKMLEELVNHRPESDTPTRWICPLMTVPGGFPSEQDTQQFVQEFSKALVLQALRENVRLPRATKNGGILTPKPASAEDNINNLKLNADEVKSVSVALNRAIVDTTWSILPWFIYNHAYNYRQALQDFVDMQPATGPDAVACFEYLVHGEAIPHLRQAARIMEQIRVIEGRVDEYSRTLSISLKGKITEKTNTIKEKITVVEKYFQDSIVARIATPDTLDVDGTDKAEVHVWSEQSGGRADGLSCRSLPAADTPTDQLEERSPCHMQSHIYKEMDEINQLLVKLGTWVLQLPGGGVTNARFATECPYTPRASYGHITPHTGTSPCLVTPPDGSRCSLHISSPGDDGLVNRQHHPTEKSKEIGVGVGVGIGVGSLLALAGLILALSRARTRDEPTDEPTDDP